MCAFRSVRLDLNFTQIVRASFKHTRQPRRTRARHAHTSHMSSRIFTTKRKLARDRGKLCCRTRIRGTLTCATSSAQTHASLSNAFAGKRTHAHHTIRYAAHGREIVRHCRPHARQSVPKFRVGGRRPTEFQWHSPPSASLARNALSVVSRVCEKVRNRFASRAPGISFALASYCLSISRQHSLAASSFAPFRPHANDQYTPVRLSPQPPVSV